MFVIGIAGGTGAGKTAVAHEIADAVDSDVTVISLDNYYTDHAHLSPDERDTINYDHPDAFDWNLLTDHLDRLQAGKTIQMPQYDFTRHARQDERVTVTPTEIVVVEGILALHPEPLRDRYDLNVYVQTDADIRILRRIKRDVQDRGRELDGIIDQYLETVKPMHDRFVTPTKTHADVIIPEGVQPKAVELLAQRVRDELD